MSQKDQKGQKTKRQLLREQRIRKERTQRLITVGIIVGIVLIVIALIAIPAIQEATAPVGEFVIITPGAWQNADRTSIGDPNAKVKIEVFEDYHCSACQSYTQNIEPLIITELVDTGKAYYTVRSYPFLDNNAALKESDQAANAAMCAAEQNRFWDYHKMLFTNVNFQDGEFSEKRLTAFADALGLDVDKFSSCYKGNNHLADINSDISLGQSLGITGTPSFFVNGVQVAPGYVPTFEQIMEEVNKILGG